jgi:hypothetical protein
MVGLMLGWAAACAPSGPAEITAAECYALRYEGREEADSTLFPRALRLAPGTDAGMLAAGPGERSGSPFWGQFGPGASWRRLTADTLDMTFSNGFSTTALIAVHDGRRLSGTASFRFQEGSEPYPVLELRGARVDCTGS